MKQAKYERRVKIIDIRSYNDITGVLSVLHLV